MNTATDAANYVSSKTSELANSVSGQTNKEVAKDSDASLGTRASAAKDMVGNKASENADAASAAINKEQVKH